MKTAAAKESHLPTILTKWEKMSDHFAIDNILDAVLRSAVHISVDRLFRNPLDYIGQ